MIDKDIKNEMTEILKDLLEDYKAVIKRLQAIIVLLIILLATVVLYYGTQEATIIQKVSAQDTSTISDVNKVLPDVKGNK